MSFNELIYTTGCLLLGSWLCSFAATLPSYEREPVNHQKEYTLVWSDEFNRSGAPDPHTWVAGKGFQRNHEAQWYQPENCYCKNGYLIIESRKAHFLNPGFDSASRDWKKQRKWVDYTSGILTTSGKKSWQYGRFELRAKIPAKEGLWPAFWTLGVKNQWPSNGEIDVMEYYQHQLLANIATGTGKANTPKWFSRKKPIAEFKDLNWADKFHVWRMDWNKDSISLYIDNQQMIGVPLDSLSNPNGTNPFMQPHYLLLNLALGGDNGGSLAKTAFPERYLIDYVRVYQKTTQ